MLNIFDSKERITPVEEVQGMIKRENVVHHAFSNLDTMVNTLGLKIKPSVEAPEPPKEHEAPVVAQSPTHDVANVAITGTTKSPAEDLALQRIYEIHDDMGRQG